MRTLLSLVVLVGCAESPRRGTDVPPFLDLTWQGHRALPMLPEGAGDEAYAAAVRSWRTATTAYALGDGVRAAELFLEAASRLNGGEPEAIARTFSAGRCLAYENAARAFTAALRFREARERLTPLAASDKACSHSISTALDRLNDERMNARFAPLWRRLRAP